MSFLKRERAVEVVAASGVVRVTVTPKPAWAAILIEAVGIAGFAILTFRDWGSISFWYRVLLIWAAATTAIAWMYQLSGSEVIEFDAQKLSISNQILGWNRTSEYQTKDGRELEWREQAGEGDAYGLQCKVGWRTVRFGEYISEQETIDVLSTLQANLPDVAQQMCASPDTSRKHFTTLDLS